MSKETMKDKIERLENELITKNEEIDSLKKINQEIQNLKNENNQLHKKNQELNEENLKLLMNISSLKIEIGTMKNENDRFKSDNLICDFEEKIHKLNFENSRLYKELKEAKKEKGIYIHNERGAGRKPAISNKTKLDIKKSRIEGNTIKQISEKFNVSVGMVHKLINENNDKIK